MAILIDSLVPEYITVCFNFAIATESFGINKAELAMQQTWMRIIPPQLANMEISITSSPAHASGLSASSWDYFGGRGGTRYGENTCWTLYRRLKREANDIATAKEKDRKKSDDHHKNPSHASERRSKPKRHNAQAQEVAKIAIGKNKFHLDGEKPWEPEKGLNNWLSEPLNMTQDQSDSTQKNSAILYECTSN